MRHARASITDTHLSVDLRGTHLRRGQNGRQWDPEPKAKKVMAFGDSFLAVPDEGSTGNSTGQADDATCKASVLAFNTNRPRIPGPGPASCVLSHLLSQCEASVMGGQHKLLR